MRRVFVRLVAFNLTALEFSRPPPLARVETYLLLACHAFGMLALAQLMRAPLWIPALVITFFLMVSFVPRWRNMVSPALLAPFGFVYAAMAIRFVWIRLARGDVPGYFDYALPDARVLLRFEFLIGAAVLYGGLIAAALFFSRARGLRFAAAAGAGAFLLWAGAEYFGHRTFGATGSDPYAYVQMGVDFATRGTFAHRFDLFPLLATGRLEWFPILHFGYHLPYNTLGDAITVWSPGGAVAFAAAFALGGERALYVVNPLFSILGALVSALLAWELTRRETQTRRIVVASSVWALMLTSHEIVNWAGVTMVDTQALVFSTLAFYAALRVYRGGVWYWAMLAGILWGAAYQVRHTQLVIVFGMLPLFVRAPFSNFTRARNLTFLFLSAFVVAVPDLWYHHAYLGSWLTPESEELALFSVNAMLPTLISIGQSASVAAEFGWLIFFVLAGIFFYARRARVENFTLLLWLAAVLILQLPYPALRLRDLIPQFLILAFYIAFGVVSVVVALWARRSVWASFAAACLIFLALELSLARVWNTLPRVVLPAPPRFGAMTQAQRASFETIAQLTPSDAVIGASLNSGAIDLYARRRAFRPTDWSPQALRDFQLVTQGNNYEMYVLEDNGSLARVLDALGDTYRIERVTTLDVPLFGDMPIANPGALWKVEFAK
jgi:hypothetical protein